MQRRYMQCDVFSGAAFMGNGLAVVLDSDGLCTDQMQAFAAWTQQAETTFLMPPKGPAADYGVRIFSATKEMPFAGHPTLGSAAAWLHAGGVARDADKLVQECAIGLVEIDLSGQVPAFVAPPTTIAPMRQATLARICDALEIAPDEVMAAVTLDNGALRQLLELGDAKRVLTLDANAVSLPAFQGISVMGRSAENADTDYEVRNLTPASLMPEDAVTGSLIAAIGVWMRKKGRMPRAIKVAQGTAMGRKGRAYLWPRGGDVMVGGQSRIVIEGTVDI